MTKAQEKIDFEETLYLDPSIINEYRGTLTEFFIQSLYRVNEAALGNDWENYSHYGPLFNVEGEIKVKPKQEISLLVTFGGQVFTYDFDFQRATLPQSKERAIRYVDSFVAYYIRRNTRK